MAQTELTFYIDDAHVQRFRDGLAGYFGYRDTVDGEPNPESKADYVRRKIIQEWKSHVLRYERQKIIEALEPEDVTIE